MSEVKPTNDEYHVASYIALINVAQLESVKDAMEQLQGVEIHAETQEGKMIITIEGSSHKAIATQVNAIQDLNGISSLAQIYHQYDT